MIKFFRNIRQKSLTENKFSKYLLYAIGEIVLVVIGILIALSLNNLNEDQKDESNRKIMLRALQSEFELNLSQLDDQIEDYNKNIHGAVSAMTKIKNESEMLADSTARKLVVEMGIIPSFDPRNGALRSSISSGHIQLIKTKELVDLLFGWEDNINDTDEWETIGREYELASRFFITKHIQAADYVSVYYPSIGNSHFESNYSKLFQNAEFEDYCTWKIAHATEILNGLGRVKDQNIKILDLIKKEIKIN